MGEEAYTWDTLEGSRTACPHVTVRLDVGHHDLPSHVQKDFSTLALIHSGSGRKRVGKQSYRIRPRSIYVIHPGVPHAYLDTEGLKLSNFCYTEALWDVLPASLQSLPGFQALFHIEPIFRGSRHYASRLELEPEAFDGLIDLIAGILPLRADNPGESLMAVSRVTDFFARLATAYETQHRETDDHDLPMRIASVTLWIERHLHEPIGIEEMAARCQVSQRTLNRLFREVFQMSAKEFLTRQRLRRAAELLCNSSLPITEVARQSGFPDNNYFSRVFRRAYGLQPRQYRAERGG